MSDSFTWCMEAWKKGWATPDKLRVWVDAKRITEDEYVQITGTPNNS